MFCDYCDLKIRSASKECCVSCKGTRIRLVHFVLCQPCNEIMQKDNDTVFKKVCYKINHEQNIEMNEKNAVN